MKRVVLAVGAVMLFATAVVAQQEIAKQQDVAKQQDDLMRALAKPQYGVLMRTARGRIPYDQAAINTALVDLEQGVAKIAKTFEVNPHGNLPDADYGSSPKVWQNKADFDSKIPAVSKAIADAKTTIKDLNSLKVAFDSIESKCSACHDTYRLKLK